ncbi:MAG: patatin family protein [Bacilli bacterium]|nr:patatin family protein [Bacilli bacterium]
MHKIGLIMEGGAMRGMFTCGVIDVLMENGIEFDGAIGVSAGSTFGCNYKSRQIGRPLRYNLKYCKDERYGTFKSVRKYGDIYEKQFCYRDIPYTLDPMDKETYESNPMEFYLVATDVESGNPVYRKIDVLDDEAMDWFQAGASMPIVSTPVEIDGHKYLDGGISDSIPLKKFQEMGYDYNVVILTQPIGYVKKKMNGLMLRLKAIRKYPAIQKAMGNRHNMYNEETAYVLKEQEAGRCLVIAPKEKLGISHTEHDPKKLQAAYDKGKEIGLACVEQVKAYIAKAKSTK